MATRSAEPSASAADFEACRQLIKRGSKSFFAASLLLPRRVRLPAFALYAFCRLSDDAVDDPGARADAVDRLRARLDRVYAGRPLAVPADRAFADVVARFDLPRALPDALLEGLAWDLEGRRYADLAELRAYCARVAAAVGAMMTVLMGVRDAAVLARACDLGVAMQLTNIARDVGEDARNGRIYLPLAWLSEEGIDPAAFLAAPAFCPGVGRLVERLLAAADDLYARAGPGVAGLPADCRAAIQSARLVYREIGMEVRRNRCNSVSRRAVVTGRRKAALVAAATALSLAPGRSSNEPALPETQFLVCAAGTAARGRPAPSAWRLVDERVGWVIELLAQLDERGRGYGGMAARPGAADPRG